MLWPSLRSRDDHLVAPIKWEIFAVGENLIFSSCSTYYFNLTSDMLPNILIILLVLDTALLFLQVWYHFTVTILTDSYKFNHRYWPETLHKKVLIFLTLKLKVPRVLFPLKRNKRINKQQNHSGNQFCIWFRNSLLRLKWKK